MHFNLHVISSEAHIFLSLDGQEMIRRRKPTVIGVDPQNKCHLSKQVLAAFEDAIPVYEGDHSLESNGLISIHLG